MKKLQIVEMERVQGGGGWDLYAASCGMSAAFMSWAFAAGPLAFGANAIYLSTCMLLVPLARASGY